MSSFLSPTKCAEQAVTEIEDIALKLSDGQRDELIRLVRQVVRDIYEASAQIAEDWCANHDRADMLCGDDICDGIAEAIRRQAEERRRAWRKRQTRLV